MDSRKHGFSIRHEQRNGRVSAVGYGRLVRVLEPDAGVGRFTASYFVLDGAAPEDPASPRVTMQVGCSASAPCTFCTGSPKCGGPPPPANVVPLGDGVPGARKILVKHTAAIAPAAPGVRPYLFDTRDDAGLHVPIFDEDIGALRGALDAYRRIAQLRSRSMAFHVFEIASAPDELAALRGKRIAIPVQRGVVRGAVAAGIKRRA
jgi:hypothetical protein